MEDQKDQEEFLLHKAQEIGERLYEEFADPMQLVAVHGIMLTQLMTGIRLSGGSQEFIQDLLNVIASDVESNYESLRDTHSVN